MMQKFDKEYFYELDESLAICHDSQNQNFTNLNQ